MQTEQLTFSFIGPKPEEFRSPFMRFFVEYCYSNKPMPAPYNTMREQLPQLYIDEMNKQHTHPSPLKTEALSTGMIWANSHHGHHFWLDLSAFMNLKYQEMQLEGGHRA